MNGWTGLVVSAAWVMSASFGCAGTTPEPSTPRYFRSPTLDYREPPRSASDGEVLGALQQAADVWLLGSASSSHAAPGWSRRHGRLYFEPEYTRAGHGAHVEAPSCPPSSAPLTPDEAEAHAALHRAWLSTSREPPLPMFASALADAPSVRSGFLSCDTR